MKAKHDPLPEYNFYYVITDAGDRDLIEHCISARSLGHAMQKIAAGLPDDATSVTVTRSDT